MDDDETYELALLIDTRTSDYGNGATLHFEIHPVKVLADGSVRNFVDWGGSTPLADLRISAQHDHVTAQPYGWRVEYAQPHSVELARAQSMVKQLRKIERGLERMRAEYAYPESFTAYVTRVAKILGAKRYGWRHPDGGLFPNGERYRWTDADSMASHVHTLVRDFGEVSA
jgi:hypothetical protein